MRQITTYCHAGYRVYVRHAHDKESRLRFYWTVESMGCSFANGYETTVDLARTAANAAATAEMEG